MLMSRLIVCVAAALGALLLGCESPNLENSLRAKITGNWVNPDTGARLVIHGDGAFELTTGGQEITGTINRGGQRVAITYVAPTEICREGIGLYYFERVGNALNFDLISDTCQERIPQILQRWVAKGTETATSLPLLDGSRAKITPVGDEANSGKKDGPFIRHGTR